MILSPGAMALADRQVAPARAGDAPLAEPARAALLAVLGPAWELRAGAIRRVYLTPDFATALALAVVFGGLAEAVGHHPDLAVHWGRLEVAWSTHDVGGVTELDLVMAARCDRAAARGLLGPSVGADA